ncbi:hypothetical protein [Candidatus Venteria ishoeyi]|uniref:Lipopolysaccharide-assembly, LptC-related n=1 Tax=Candidatus Venteria ishoeyi TaxID=1899563 RepID=A0A1H6FGT0_9GAMM|nr:hypothetical protein [Candidatus Venteria ishoeyi]SEH08641.1 Uncharacterised protein [Candidatus Venteria ishoeyi]
MKKILMYMMLIIGVMISVALVYSHHAPDRQSENNISHRFDDGEFSTLGLEHREFNIHGQLSFLFLAKKLRMSRAKIGLFSISTFKDLYINSMQLEIWDLAPKNANKMLAAQINKATLKKPVRKISISDAIIIFNLKNQEKVILKSKSITGHLKTKKFVFYENVQIKNKHISIITPVAEWGIKNDYLYFPKEYTVYSLPLNTLKYSGKKAVIKVDESGLINIIPLEKNN